MLQGMLLQSDRLQKPAPDSRLRTPDWVLRFDESSLESGVWSLLPAVALAAAEVRLTAEASSRLRTPDSVLGSAVRQVQSGVWSLEPSVGCCLGCC